MREPRRIRTVEVPAEPERAVFEHHHHVAVPGAEALLQLLPDLRWRTSVEHVAGADRRVSGHGGSWAAGGASPDPLSYDVTAVVRDASLDPQTPERPRLSPRPSRVAPSLRTR